MGKEKLHLAIKSKLVFFSDSFNVGFIICIDMRVVIFYMMGCF